MAQGSCLGVTQCAIDQALRLTEEDAQMLLAAKALAVDLVDVLGPRRPGGEPASGGDHLDAADRGLVAGRAIEHGLDALAAQLVAVSYTHLTLPTSDLV